MNSCQNCPAYSGGICCNSPVRVKPTPTDDEGIEYTYDDMTPKTASPRLSVIEVSHDYS